MGFLQKEEPFGKLTERGEWLVTPSTQSQAES